MAKHLKDMLDLSVNQSVEKICRKSEVAEVLHSSLAGFVTRTMLGNIRYFKNLVDVCRGEMKSEDDFSLQKLWEHLEIVLILHRFLVYATGTREERPRDQQNLLPIAFGVTSPGRLRLYKSYVDEMKGAIEDNIIVPINELVGKIVDADAGDRASEIETLLLTRVVPSLNDVLTSLVKLEASVGKAVTRTADAFRKNRKKLTMDRNCRPQE